MNILPNGLAEHCAGEATTLCRCWKLIRCDGVVLGFTDHDRELVFEGTSFLPSGGLSATTLEQRTGLGADSQQVNGVLQSESITAADIRADRYDGARMELWVVNWSLPQERFLDRVLHIDAITEQDGIFRAELVGQSAVLDRTAGRRFARRCDANLGDARCGVNLEPFTLQTTIAAVKSASLLEMGDAAAFPSGWFRGGLLRFVSGAQTGLEMEIAEHLLSGSLASLNMWKPLAELPETGDQVELVAGCDKRFATCRTRFANSINFRGFPHIPGNDAALGYASSFTGMDGGVIVP
ncbi:MAG: DUF2163 domain-containing protein [Nitratireductor sp.]|nr:DUF2163 domain-containing protein [Nitratireductor sp.]